MPLDKELDKKQLAAIRDRFIALSDLRWQRLLQSMTPVQADRLKLLPLLIHCNNPTLPGYIPGRLNSALPDYLPSREALSIAKSVAPAYYYRGHVPRRFLLTGLYLMGSAGSLGQGQRSDIDLWLIVRADSSDPERLMVQRKAETLAAWYADFGIEISTYVVPEDTFSIHREEENLNEPIGHRLLLDEFYRSAIYLAGRWLLWWLIPDDNDYALTARRLLQQRHIDPAQWLDLGPVGQVPSHEFLQTAMHQLHKAVQEPYKSVIKLALIEYYAALQPSGQLLSDKFKLAVWQDQPRDELDPYVMLLSTLDQWLCNNPKRRRNLRRCFYLKSEIKVDLSKKTSKEMDWRRSLMRQWINRWQWSTAEVEYLNQRNRWQIEDVRRERQLLYSALNASYRFIRDFSRIQGLDNKRVRKLLIQLARQLYVIYESAPDKIVIENPGIAPRLYYPLLTLVYADGQWAFYAGAPDSSQLLFMPSLYQHKHLVALMSWAVINGFVDADTRVLVPAGLHRISPPQVERLMQGILRWHEKTALLPNAWHQQQQYHQALLIVNAELSAQPPHALTQGYRINADQDPFNFGEHQISLLQRADLVLASTWGATFCRPCDSGHVLMALCSQLEAVSCEGISIHVCQASERNLLRMTLQNLLQLVEYARSAPEHVCVGVCIEGQWLLMTLASSLKFKTLQDEEQLLYAYARATTVSDTCRLKIFNEQFLEQNIRQLLQMPLPDKAQLCIWHSQDRVMTCLRLPDGRLLPKRLKLTQLSNFYRWLARRMQLAPELCAVDSIEWQIPERTIDAESSEQASLLEIALLDYRLADREGFTRLLSIQLNYHDKSCVWHAHQAESWAQCRHFVASIPWLFEAHYHLNISGTRTSELMPGQQLALEYEVLHWLENLMTS